MAFAHCRTPWLTNDATITFDADTRFGDFDVLHGMQRSVKILLLLVITLLKPKLFMVILGLVSILFSCFGLVILILILIELIVVLI